MKRDNRVKAGRVLKHTENQVILMTPETVGLLLISKRKSRMMTLGRVLNHAENQVILETVDVHLISKRNIRMKGAVITLGGACMLQTTYKENKDRITLKREETITPMIIIALRNKTTLRGRKKEEMDIIENQISQITTEDKTTLKGRKKEEIHFIETEDRKNSEKGRKKRKQMMTIKGEE